MSTRQPQPQSEAPPSTAAAPATPPTWQAAIIAWLWRSRHREKLVVLIIIGFLLVGVWTFATKDIGDNSALGRVITWVGRSRAAELQPRHINNPAQFQVLERIDFVDLDTYRDVPTELLSHNVSPTIRETRLQLRKLSVDLKTFYNHSKTTGAGHDVVCLSGQVFTVKPVKPETQRGAQVHDEYELAIDIAAAPAGSLLDLRWQTVSWNKFQGENNWWTSVVAGYNIGKLVLVVDFPAEATITLRDITLKRRRPPDTSFTTLPAQTYAGQLTHETSTGKITWTIPQAESGYEYAMFWGKSLASVRAQ